MSRSLGSRGWAAARTNVQQQPSFQQHFQQQEQQREQENDGHELAGMVDQVFNILDTDGSGILSFEELRLLSQRTEGTAMTHEDYLQVKARHAMVLS